MATSIGKSAAELMASGIVGFWISVEIASMRQRLDAPTRRRVDARTCRRVSASAHPGVRPLPLSGVGFEMAFRRCMSLSALDVTFWRWMLPFGVGY